MATVESIRTGPRTRTQLWRGYALGLRLESVEPFPGLQIANGAAPNRLTSWRTETAEAIETAWRVRDGHALLDRRHSDGRLFLRVDAHGSLGYRVWAPYYGRHLVTADGSSIASALPRVPPARWQRLFFAQVLPLAAALRGLSVFHASAISVRGRAIAFVGPPGAGKTSLAAHLIALGAEFVTDDVLALEPADGAVIAHPGPSRLSIDEAELRRIPSTQEVRIGPCIGRSDKLMLEPTPVAGPLELSALYFLQPGRSHQRIAVRDYDASSSRHLLGSSFLTYLDSPRFLERHLDICAAIARSVRLHDVELPPGSRARDVAARVLAHAESRP